MSTRIYNKSIVPVRKSTVRDRIMQQRMAQVDLRRAKPGIYRTSGAWKRSLPGRQETHYNDCSFSQTLGTAGGGLTLTCLSPLAAGPINPNGVSLNLISQGTSQNQRIGNKVCLHAIRARGVFQLINNITNSSAVVRVLLVRDKQCNGAQAVPADVLEVTAAATTDYNAFLDMDNLDRFDIIKDKTYKIGESGFGIVGTGSAVCTIPFKMSHKIKNPSYQEIIYSSTTGAITEVRSNNYFFLVFASNANVTLSGKTRVYWRE